MERPSLLACLLACLLAFGGCSGLAEDAGGNAGAGLDARSDGASGAGVTPAPVPTIERTEAPGSELAPGLTEDGLTDPDALLAGHRSVLEDTNYTVRAVVNATRPDGTTYYRSAARARVTERRDGYRYSSRFDRPNGSSSALVRYASWSGGGTILTAAMRRENTTVANGTAERGTATGNETADREVNGENTATTYGAIRSEYERDTGLYGLPRYGERIHAQLGVAETALRERTSAAGPSSYRLTVSNVSDLRALADGRFRDPRNVTGRVLVSPQGFVREYRLHYTATTPEGHTVRVAESISYSEVGRTTVERPPWYEAALNATDLSVAET